MLRQMQEQPLILTLRMDEESEAFFNAKRQFYFPPERNFLNAHLMLFHQLPNKIATHDFFDGFAYKLFSTDVTGLMNLGAGVAYRIESNELSALHKSLSRHFQDVLIPQNRQGLRPHVTIMNKTTPEQARVLIMELMIDFRPFKVAALELDLWTYLDGPWHHEKTYLFG